MNPARYMLLMNVKGASWSPQPRGGKGGWRWEEVASALSLGNLHPLAATLGRAKYCEDPACCQQLLKAVQTLVAKQAKTQKWRCRSEMPARLAQLATHEVLHITQCEACGGRGSNKRMQSCGSCHGTGRSPMKSAERYHYAGIDKRNWERRWQARYEGIYLTLCDAENQLLGHLAWQLG